MTCNPHKLLLLAGLTLTMTIAAQSVQAGPLRDRLAQRQAAGQQADTLEEESSTGTAPALVAGIRVLHDVAYGPDPAQRFDVYLPESAQLRDVPVIFMVHGGGWRRGDKAMPGVVQNKVNRWVPKGFIVVSVNYRMLPNAGPTEQARDVSRALAIAQTQAASWGGDRDRFIMMGHSAGAHLVALVVANDRAAAEAGTGRALGVVMLDSAALNVVSIMEGRHMRLYDDAFGANERDWIAASPYHQLRNAIMPALAVCSAPRRDSCKQAQDFVAKAVSLGSRASVLPVDLSHREINVQLGKNEAYTADVERFMASLDGAVARRLARSPSK